MAIDKAVDSAVLDANLTSIADTIRAKAGTSDKLAFPAGFAEAIAAIEAGGGSAGGVEIKSETFIPAEDTHTFIVSIGSKKPIFRFLAPNIDSTNLIGDGLINNSAGVYSAYDIDGTTKKLDFEASKTTLNNFASLPNGNYAKLSFKKTYKAIGQAPFRQLSTTLTTNELGLGTNSDYFRFLAGVEYIYIEVGTDWI
jgi:hypothetical protein